MPAISIIVPVFNCQDYLEACVASLQAQTYKDFELILIDGGGTDRSGLLCDELAQHDERIRVLHKSNEGVSIARNKGIAMARGTWLNFMDADDTVAPDYLEKLMALTTAPAQPELVLCNMSDVYGDAQPVKRTLPAPLTGDFREDYAALHSLLIGPVIKLYQKRIILEHRLCFPAGIHCGEDELFNFQYYHYVRTYAFLDEGLYYYYHRPNDSLSQKLSPEVYRGMLYKLQQEQRFCHAERLAHADSIVNSSALKIALQYRRLSPADTYDDFLKRLEELLPFINVHAPATTPAEQHQLALLREHRYEEYYHGDGDAVNFCYHGDRHAT